MLLQFDFEVGVFFTAVIGTLLSPYGCTPPRLMVGPKPSSPESNRPFPFASGKLMPLPRLHGALHAVTVWKRTVNGLSLLTNVRLLPWTTDGGRPRLPRAVRSPCE